MSLFAAINVDAFLKSLPMMGLGMLGIFTVICSIWLVIYLLNKIFTKKNKK